MTIVCNLLKSVTSKKENKKTKKPNGFLIKIAMTLIHRWFTFTGVRRTLTFSSHIGDDASRSCTLRLGSTEAEDSVGEHVNLSFSLVVRASFYKRMQPKSRM